MAPRQKTGSRRWFAAGVIGKSLRPTQVHNDRPRCRPCLETLEARLAPAYVPLGTQLAFEGDLQATGTTYTSKGPIKMGLQPVDQGNFQPVMEVTGGLSFDTASNPDALFTVGKGNSLQSLDAGGSPLYTLFTAAADTSINGQQIKQGQFDLPGATFPVQAAGVDLFEFSVTSLGIHPVTISDISYQAVTVHGTMAIDLGKGGQNPNSTSISATGPADSLLYVSGALPNGFDLSGLGSLQVTGDFEFYGVTFAAPDLSVDFTGWGNLTVTGTAKLNSQAPSNANPIQKSAFELLDVSVQFGDSGKPGLMFSDWNVTEFDVSVSAAEKFQLFGLDVQANGDLAATYNNKQGSDGGFDLSGSLSLSLQAWQATANLDISIQEDGVIEFPGSGISFKMDGLNLGVFSIPSASLSFSTQPDTKDPTVLDLQISGSGAVSLPGGWGAGLRFAFEIDDDGGSFSGFQLEEIGFTVSGSVPVGDTDVFITSASATVSGIGTQNWSVYGSLGLTFGQSIPIGGKNVSLVRAVGSFTLDKDELILAGQVAFLGYSTSSGGVTTLHSDVGLLDGNITLDWGDNTYSASVNGSFLDGTFTVEGEFKYSPGTIYVSSTAALNVPDGIPLIGGDQLASANFLLELQYDVGDLSKGVTGFVAGWISLHHLGDVGIEYDVTTRKIELIGKKGVEALQANPPPPVQNYNAYARNFVIPALASSGPPFGATNFNFLVQWVPNGGGDYYITLLTPDQKTITLQGGTISGKDSEIQSFVDTTTDFVIPNGQQLVSLQADNGSTPLPANTYVLTLYTTDTLDPNAIVWTGTAGYAPPTVGAPIGVLYQEPNVFAGGSIDPALLSQTTVTVYLDQESSGYHGVKVGTGGYDPIDGTYSASIPQLTSPMGLAPTPYYVYLVVDDGINPAVQSPYSAAFTPYQPLQATVMETGDGRNRPLTGFTVSISFDIPSFRDRITNANGLAWWDLGTFFPPGFQFELTLALPASGFVIAEGGKNPVKLTYNGSEPPDLTTYEFKVWQETTIAGIVLDDENSQGGQGPLSSLNTGVGGVTVYLDLNDNGQFDTGEPRTATLANGTYELISVPPSKTYTVRYQLPEGYLAGGGPSSYAVAVGSDPYARYEGSNFTLVKEATIRGTVQGDTISGGQLGTTPFPLAGWTIKLTGPISQTMVTDTSGNYEFRNLVPGNYTIEQQTMSGWKQIAPYTTNPSLAPSFHSFDGPVTGVATADFNNDGNLDLATVGESVFLYYLLGNGDGTFGTAHRVSGVPSGVNLVDIQTGNFNADGYTDLLLFSIQGSGDSRASIPYISYGSATGFGPLQQVWLSDSNSAMGIAAGGDFDDDNIDDFVVYGYFGGSIYVNPCLSSNQFARDQSLDFNVPADGWTLTGNPLSLRSVVVADFNNDKILDLFMNFGTMSASDATVASWIAYGQGKGQFGNNGGPDLPIPVPANAGPASAADINGDNLVDLVLSDFTGYQQNPATPQTTNLYVFQQTSVATFIGLDGLPASSSSPGLSTNGPVVSGQRYFFVPAVGLADINGDGKVDITVALNPYDNNEAQILAYFNQGNNSKSLAQFNTDSGSYYLRNLAVNGHPDSMVLGDYNNDGQVDYQLGDPSYNPEKLAGAGGVWGVLNKSQLATTPTITVQGNGEYTVNFSNLEVAKPQLYGVVFDDLDGDGVREANEPGRAGVIVYLDANGNGILDPGEPYRTTNAAGLYAFGGLTPNKSGHLQVLPGLRPEEYASPTKGFTVTLGQSDTSVDLAIRQRLLQPLADTILTAGQTLSITSHLTSVAEQLGLNRSNRYVFTLAGGAPAGLAIDPGTGVLTWTPASTQPPGNFAVTVRAHNTINPLQADEQTFQITVLAPNASFIDNVYLFLLGRPADTRGLPYWVFRLDDGATRTQIVLDMENASTNEFRKDEVNRLYERYLARSAFDDPQGLIYWVAVLQAGMTIEQVAASIVNSPEYVQKHTNGSFDSWLDAFYKDVFQRAVDTAGRNYWNSLFQSGQSREQIALEIFTAPPLPGQQGNEYQLDLIDDFYTRFLGRSSRQDPGANYWLSQLQQGVRDEVIIAGIIASDEFFAKKAPASQAGST